MSITPPVRTAAEKAEMRAEDAMRAWREGKTDAALEYMRQAVSIESDYGDSPTWGPVLSAMRGAK